MPHGDLHLAVGGLLDAVQSAADAFLARAVIGEEVDIDIAPHTAVYLGGVDDGLHLGVHHKGSLLAGSGEHPAAPALLTEGGAVAGPGAIAIVDADSWLGRTYTAPLGGDARLDGLGHRLVDSGLGGRVALGNQDGAAELGLSVRIIERGAGLEQIAVGKTNSSDRDRHNDMASFS